MGDEFNSEILTYLKKEEIPYRTNTPGSKLCTMAVGGPIDLIIEYNSFSQLQKTLQFLRTSKRTYKILGAGSNVIIPDSGIHDVVLKPGKGWRTYEFVSDDVIYAGSAMPLMQLSRKISEIGLSGLEFAGGIPAQVGGAVYMNAGAHKSEMVNVIKQIDWCDESGEKFTNSPQDFSFSYRHSGLPDNAVILGVTLSLKKGDKEKVLQCMQDNLAYRKSTQPLQLPSSGSVFKNPTGVAAGKLIEDCGLKGYAYDDAEISRMHANWIVNRNRKATAFAVKALIAYAQQKVEENFDIHLKPEVQLW